MMSETVYADEYSVIGMQDDAQNVVGMCRLGGVWFSVEVRADVVVCGDVLAPIGKK